MYGKSPSLLSSRRVAPQIQKFLKGAYADHLSAKPQLILTIKIVKKSLALDLNDQTPTQKPVAGNGNVPSSNRDTRPTSRAYYSQETLPRNAPPSRPPSTTGFKTQQSNASVSAFHASSSTRPPPVQRPAATPQASSSRTRLDVPDTRNYFAKMFSKKPTSSAAQPEDKYKSMQRERRNSQAYPANYASAPAVQASGPSGPIASWTAYDSSGPGRESDRDDGARQKTREDRKRAETIKEDKERARKDSAVYKTRTGEIEPLQADIAKTVRPERPVSRANREERRQQEYESDNARRRLQAQPAVPTSSVRQEARLSHYLHPTPIPPTNRSRATAPPLDIQQMHMPQAAIRPSGVPVQSSNSSQSTSVSLHTPASHPTHAPISTNPTITSASASASASVPTPTPITPSFAVPPPRANFISHQTLEHLSGQKAQYPIETIPNTPAMVEAYNPWGAEDQNRLDREAAEREALLSRQKEEHELERRREVEREAAERQVAREKEAAEREVQQHHEREREREQEREGRRARRAERERKKELEHAERERRKEIERAERERLKLQHQQDLERHKEAERLRRERKEFERAEKERLKVEKERQREAERMDRARQYERERERALRSAARHRSHRETQSMPTNTLAEATSGSDTDKMSRKEGRHRSQSYPAAVVADFQPLVAPPGFQRPDTKKDNVPVPAVSLQSSASRQDDMFSRRDSTFYGHIPLRTSDRRDHLDDSRMAQPQQLTPPKVPERSHTDSLPSNDLPARGMHASFDPAQESQPFLDGVQPKLVSIFASQGPADRTPYRATQNMAPIIPKVEQAASGHAFVTATNGHEGRTRLSVDHPSHRASTAPPATATPSLMSTTQRDYSTTTQAPSATLLRQFMQSTPGSAIDATSFSSAPAPHTPVRPDTAVPSHGKFLTSADVSVPPSSDQNARQPNLNAARQTAYDRLAEIDPAAFNMQAMGVSSYSQTVLGISQEQTRVSTQDQVLSTMSRVPSNNSTRSPSRKAGELPADTPNESSSVPIFRTSSDASRSADVGRHQQLLGLNTQSQLQATSSRPSQRPIQSVPATPMYSLTHNISSTPRAPHDSITNDYQQSVNSTHPNPNSQSLQTPSNYPYNSNKHDAGLTCHDNIPNLRAAAPPVQTAVVDASRQQYASTQHPPSQNKSSHNPSTNAYLQMQQQQQSQVMQPSPVQDGMSSLRMQSHANNLSSYSAAAASNKVLQAQSTMFSQTNVQQSGSSVYHSSSNSRNFSSMQQTQYQQASGSFRPTLPQHSSSPVSNLTIKPSGPPTDSGNNLAYVTSTRPPGPFIDDTPSSGKGLSLDSPSMDRPSLESVGHSTERATIQPVFGRPRSASGPPSTPTPARMLNQGEINSQTEKGEPLNDMDSPPPLTPSSSSRESHEEILMTPASLNTTRGPVNVQQPPDNSQRSEKKKGGLFGIFRSGSTKSTKEKEVRGRVEAAAREYEARRQVPGSSHDQRSESANGPRSTRPPSVMIKGEPEPNRPNGGSSNVNQQQTKESRASRRVPPPITIPPQSIPYRLFTSKSKRYRTMSSASLEALDGTANNTVVGSPTSSRRSPTPSGPMTPPIRDPMEAAQAWRSNEGAFLDGSQRRHKPGVTFDVKSDEGQTDGAQYRRRSSLRRQRR